MNVSDLAPEPTVRRPLQWYVDRLTAGVPTVSLLYGDGEFLAADPANVGRALQNAEVVTRTLQREVGESLRAAHDGPDLVRGTDPVLLDWRCYGGRDVEVVKTAAGHADVALAKYRPEGGVGWTDGRVWDEAVRAGELYPLLKWINATPRVTVVCHPGYTNKSLPWGPYVHFVTVPKVNASSSLEDVWSELRDPRGPFLLCCGLSAIPLAMRSRSAFPGCTVLDLGSTLDVFFDLGRERGWRNEIYNDSRALKALRAANLKELA